MARTMIMYCGIYNSATVYNLSDQVSSGGVMYLSIVSNNVGQTLTNTSYWIPA